MRSRLSQIVLVAALLLGALAALSSAAEEAAPAADAAAPETATPTEPAREPITQIEGSAPTETPRERLERFKRERGAGSDKPFEGFATEAEREMQRQRQAAIGGSAEPAANHATTDADRALEQEILSDDEIAESRAAEHEYLQDRLANLGAWGASGCVTQEPDWSQQDDWIRHRKLTRGDFLSQKEGKVKLAVRVPNSQTAAYVALVFSCEVKPELNEVRPGLWSAEVAAVHYYALLSRHESFWAQIADQTEEYTLGHEQLHFDIADAFARWLNQNRTKILARMRGTGSTPEEAAGRLQLTWAKHMMAVQEDYDALETAYDRETKHGTVLPEQTRWHWRMQDGFEEIAKSTKLRSREYVK